MQAPIGRSGSALLVAAVLSAVPSSFAAADNPRARAVISTDFGEEWPLTEYSAAVNCLRGGHAVVITSSGVYAMNGMAKNFSKVYGYRDIREISKPHPEYGGVEADIGPLLKIALEMC